MKYKASEIIERALDLADIQNTDFLSHKEHERYINDSWKQTYQMLINKGDKQFVKETYLYGAIGTVTEYQLPDDLYQMESLKNEFGQEIPRNSKDYGYEIVNDKLRIINCPSRLKLTYYTVPIDITFPDKTIEWQDVDEAPNFSWNNVIFMNGTKILYWYGADHYYYEGAVGCIYDVSTRNYVTFDFYNLKTELSEFDDLRIYMLSNGNMIVDDKYGRFAFVSQYGEILTELSYDSISVKWQANLITNEVRAAYYDSYSKKWLDYECYTREWTRLDEEPEYHNFVAGDIYTDGLTVVKGNETIELDEYVKPVWRTDNTLAFGKQFVICDDSDFVLHKADLKHNIVIGNLDYGPVTTDDNHNYFIESREEDTLFNFPNELYVTLIAADLAMRYAMKMNSDFSGLQQLYDASLYTFLDTLSQSADYSSVVNLYI